MFAEFTYCTLAVFLILCMSRDGYLRYQISFDAFLGATFFSISALIAIIDEIRSVLPTLKVQARAKVRAKHVRQAFDSSSLVLRSVS